MEFCENCDNMLYTRIVNTDSNNPEATSDEIQEKLTYFCRCCGNTKDDITKTTSSIYSINFKKQSMINPYTFNDPTLPKAIGVNCPNTNCPSKSKSSNIIYINYDEKDMKYIYICLDCHKNKIEPHIW